MEENEIKKCIVKIKKNNLHGTGFFIDTNKILTCFHVIKDVEIDEVKVVFNGEDYSVELVDKKEEFEIDLAILKVEVNNKNFLKIDNTISDEDKLRSYGFANSEDYFENAPKNFDRGCVPVTLEYEGTDDHFMKFKNAQVEGGHSGSPIINLSTQSVCGVLNISRHPDNNLGGYGIPIEKLSLLKYEKNYDRDMIEETIILDNGKSFKFKMVKIDLPDKSLYVSIYPVTFEEYDLFCEDTTRSIPDDEGLERKNKSVINVNWSDAMDYCTWLNTKKKVDGCEYRLPTIKEWEYIANKNLNKNDYSEKIGLLGICDMYGKLLEWTCRDKYLDKNEDTRIAKGSSYRKSRKYIYDVTKYEEFIPTEKNDEVTFRVIREDVI